jgi:hypothetical protein
LTLSGGSAPPAFETRIIMFARPKAALLPLWVLTSLQMLLSAVQAQTNAAAQPPASAAASARRDPADPKAQVPAASYVSPLRAYQAFAEPQLVPWGETNEVVRQRGGWRAYAREAGAADATQTVAPAASQAAQASKAASSGHGGHGMK